VSRLIISARAVSPIVNATVPPQATDENEQRPVNPARLAVMIEDNNGAFRSAIIGQVTANHVCAGIRGALLTDLLRRLHLTRENLATAIQSVSTEAPRILYHTLYSGGTLGVSKTLIPEFDLAIEQRLRKEWPVMSLLGASMGASMLASHIKVHPLLPASERLAFMFPEEPAFTNRLAPFNPEDTLIVAADGDNDNNPAVGFVRHMDRIVPLPTATNAKGKPYYRPQVQPRIGYIAPGTPLLGWIDPLIDLPPVEAGALSHGLALFAARGQLGGKGHMGFGEAAIQIHGAADPQPYLDWVAADADRIRAELLGEQLPFWIAA
jgi:hypothetical protein